jgi:hypothetical protein
VSIVAVRRSAVWASRHIQWQDKLQALEEELKIEEVKLRHELNLQRLTDEAKHYSLKPKRSEKFEN